MTTCQRDCRNQSHYHLYPKGKDSSWLPNVTPSFTPPNVRVWMTVCLVTLFTCVYITLYTKYKNSQATTFHSFPHISLYLTPLPILSQYPTSVLSGIWSSQSLLNPTFPAPWMFPSNSCPNWNLTLLWGFRFSLGPGGGGGGGGVPLAPRCCRQTTALPFSLGTSTFDPAHVMVPYRSLLPVVGWSVYSSQFWRV